MSDSGSVLALATPLLFHGISYALQIKHGVGGGGGGGEGVKNGREGEKNKDDMYELAYPHPHVYITCLVPRGGGPGHRLGRPCTGTRFPNQVMYRIVNFPVLTVHVLGMGPGTTMVPSRVRSN